MHTFAPSHSPHADASADAASTATPAGGEIFISPRVVFTLALSAALATYGVVGIASRFTGNDCTNTDPRRGLEIGIDRGDQDDRNDPSQKDKQAHICPHVTVTIHIVAEYGVRIQAVTNSLQHQIKYRIERSTGYIVDAVQVHVAGLRVTHAT